MPAASQPESQDDILAAALASLTAADIPPDDHEQALPDPDTGRPADLAGLSSAELDELLAAVPAAVPEVIPAGCLPRDGTGRGTGFADGGALDVLAPGVALAGFADDAHARLSVVSDDELIGVLRGWWRQTSWAQARALAAMAELARRRPADRTPPAPPGQFPAVLSEFIPDEIGMALTLTKTAAETQLGLALEPGRPSGHLRGAGGGPDRPAQGLADPGGGRAAVGRARRRGGGGGAARRGRADHRGAAPVGHRGGAGAGSGCGAAAAGAGGEGRPGGVLPRPGGHRHADRPVPAPGRGAGRG